MANRSDYWADRYVEKQRDGESAIAMIRPGQRVFIGSSCGQPQQLAQLLADAAGRYTDVEIIRLMSMESSPLSAIAAKSGDQALNIRSLYLGSGGSKSFEADKRFITPINLSAVPRLFKSRRMPIHVALIQTSEPDDFGWMSLGVSVDISLAAAQSADLVIAQVNPQVPRVSGRSFIHVNDVDVVVEHEEPLMTIEHQPEPPEAEAIGRIVARLIDDGSTLHIDPGAAPQATLHALAGKQDLGIHTEWITDGIMRLVAQGVVTNHLKGHGEGKLVASGAMGSPDLYEFLNDNPSIDFQPSDYVNNPDVIQRHNKMISICVAEAMDLTGQVAADALRHNHFIGVTGMLDFVRGAARAEGGKSILLLPTTGQQGQTSRIVPRLDDLAVVVPRGDVDYVVTEYGMVRLFGKSLQERAMAMVSIAHPDHRDRLFDEARQLGLLSPGQSLSEAIHGIYPVHLEEERDLDGEPLTLRAAKPVDQRRIQEHFYTLDREDVVMRFFHEKTCFLRDEVECVSQVDYVKDLTLLAMVGEIGFSRVVAVGVYLLEESTNMAEVAFSVSGDMQGRGVGKMVINKLADAAKDNDIDGLVAYTSPMNQGMIRLFNALPYKVRSTYDADMLTLQCRFDDPK